MILADTSIWIEFLKAKAPVHEAFGQLLEEGNVATTGVIAGELLQGAKNERERRVIHSYWSVLPHSGEPEDWLHAGTLSCNHRLLSKGVGLIDAFLIAVAESTQARLWTLDKTLDRVLAGSFPHCRHEADG